MADNTGIEWADATWNPVWGCTPVSPGCDHCYAETLVNGRLAHLHPGGFRTVRLRPEQLDKPLRWRRARRIFVNSMSDLFHVDIPDDYIAKVFAVMAAAPQHTFQVLTKRHGRMRSLLNSKAFYASVRHLLHDEHGFTPLDAYGTELFPLPNVWLGVSVENQQWADIRIPALLDTPAAVRFLSCEPLLGPVDLTGDLVTGGGADSVDWVIVGGESGRDARPMHPDWARSLRDQCTATGVPFHFKQWGEWVPESLLLHPDNAPAAFLATDGTVRPLIDGKPSQPPMARGHDITVRRVGKKVAGRLLDGRTWDEYPEQVTP